MVMGQVKFNPGFLSDEELVDSFCVRTSEFEMLVETLRESTDNSNPHVIVVGPRGIGKTMLLLRVVVEVRRDRELRSAWFPVIFPEESYEVGTAGEFWLQCVSHLADQVPTDPEGLDLALTLEELREERDDRRLADRCLGTVLDFARREEKRLLLVVENLNTMFDGIGDPDVGWALRHTLQNEPRIFLMGSATSRFAEIQRPDRAMYDLFQVYELNPLDTESCATLWKGVSGRNVRRRSVRALEILTGGNPRLLTIVAQFGAKLSFLKLMDGLLGLVDDHTEYFRSHLEALGTQDRRVYVALARLWKPATAREVSCIARLPTSHCSALLRRLVERGAVLVAGGTPRRKEYYLAERMYNIYYLLRLSRGANRLVEALVRFMAAFYSRREPIGLWHKTNSDASNITGEKREMRRTMIQCLSQVVRPADEEMALDFAPKAQLTVLAAQVAGTKDSRESDESKLVDSSVISRLENLVKRGMRHRREQDFKKLIVVSEEIQELIARDNEWTDSKYIVIALLFEVVATLQLESPEKAIRSCDKILGLGDIEGSSSEKFQNLIAIILEIKIKLLFRIGNSHQMVRTCRSFRKLLDHGDTVATDRQLAKILCTLGLGLMALGQSKNASAVFEEVIERFGTHSSDDLDDLVAWATIDRARILNALGHTDAAYSKYDSVVQRFGSSNVARVADAVAKAMLLKGHMLVEQNRLSAALDCFDNVSACLSSQNLPHSTIRLVVAQYCRGSRAGNARQGSRGTRGLRCGDRRVWD